MGMKVAKAREEDVLAVGVLLCEGIQLTCDARELAPCSRLLVDKRENLATPLGHENTKLAHNSAENSSSAAHVSYKRPNSLPST